MRLFWLFRETPKKGKSEKPGCPPSVARNAASYPSSHTKTTGRPILCSEQRRFRVRKVVLSEPCSEILCGKSIVLTYPHTCPHCVDDRSCCPALCLSSFCLALAALQHARFRSVLWLARLLSRSPRSPKTSLIAHAKTSSPPDGLRI